MKKRDWQKFLDVYAYYENLPIRILAIENLNNLSPHKLFILNASKATQYDDGSAESKISTIVRTISKSIANVNGTKYLDTPSLVNDRSSELGEGFNKLGVVDSTSRRTLLFLEQNVWITQYSNPLYIHNLFRLCDEWRWYELAWFYSNRDKLRDWAENKQFVSAFGSEDWKLRLVVLDKNHAIVVGPVHIKNSLQQNYHLGNIRRTNLLESYSVFHAMFATKSLTKRLPREDLERFYSARLPILRSIFEDRLKRVVSYIESSVEFYDRYENLFLSEIESVTDFIAENMVSANKIISNLEIDNSKKLQGIPLGNLGQLSICANYSNGGIRLDLRSIGKTPIVSLDATTLEELNRGKNQIIYDSHSEVFEEIIEKVTARRRNTQISRARMLSDWLNNHLIDPGKLSSSITVNHVCRIILEGLRAEYCQIYNFYPSNGTVKVVGAAYNRNKYEKHRNSFVNELDEICIFDESHKSVVKTVITTKTSHYINRVNQDDPKMSIFMTDGSDLPIPKSVLVTPIIYKYKVMGVIELHSYTGYGIGEDKKYLLNSYANILAEHYFSQQVVSSLSHITSETSKLRPVDFSDIQKKDISKYPLSIIAENLCELFAVNGASIWLRDRTLSFVYYLFGHSGENVFREELTDSGGRVSFSMRSKNDSAAVAVRLVDQYINTNKSHIYAKIDPNAKKSTFVDGFMVLGSKYFTGNNFRKHRESLKKSGYKEIRAFILEDPVNVNAETSSEYPLGVVTLFDKEFTNTPNWESLAELVGINLGTVIGKLYVLHDIENRRAEIVEHEISQNITQIELLLEPMQRNLDLISTNMKSIMPAELISFFENKTFLSENIPKERLRRIFELTNLTVAKLRRIQQSGVSFVKEQRNLKMRLHRLSAKTELLKNLDEYSLPNLIGIDKNSKSFCSLRNVFLDVYFAHEKRLKERYLSTNIEAASNRKDQEYDDLRSLDLNDVNDALFNTSTNLPKSYEGIPSGIIIYMHEAALHYVFSNIFSNALKYARPSTHITVNWEVLSLHDKETSDILSYSRISIKNACAVKPRVGNPQELFDYKVRQYNYSKDAIRDAVHEAVKVGDGIGLYLIKEICNLYGLTPHIRFELDKSTNQTIFNIGIDIPDNMSEYISRI